MSKESWLQNCRRYWKLESLQNRRRILLYGLGQSFSTLLDLAILAFVMPLITLMSSGGKDDALSNSWLSSITGDGSASDSIIKIFLLMLVGYIFKSLAQSITKYRAKIIRTRLSIEISDKLFRSYLNENYEWHTKSASPLLVRNVNEAFLVVDHQITPLIITISESILVIAIVSLFMFVQPLATLCAGLLVALVSLMMFRILSTRIQHLGTERLEQDGLRVSLLTQAFAGIREVKLLSLESRLIRDVSLRNRRALGAANNSVLIGELTPIMLELTVMASICILVIVGVILGIETSNMLTLLAFFSVGAIRMIPSFARISSAFQLLRFSTKRVSTILESLERSSRIGDFPTRSLDRENLLDVENALTCRDVFFRYQGADENTLSNISFSLPTGTMLGLTGTSGSGKTTLMDIAMGLLHPDSGVIEILGSSSENIKWGDIAYVSQDVFLFSGSLQENILMGTSSESLAPNRMREVLELADLTNFVASLENGLSTVLSEKGATFSGGQRQRIGLARAIAQNPKLLVLDEATSSLDDFSEKRILSNLRNLGTSIIMISHSLTSLEHCNRLLLLEKGCIIADGTPSEVLKKYHEIHLPEAFD